MVSDCYPGLLIMFASDGLILDFQQQVNFFKSYASSCMLSNTSRLLTLMKTEKSIIDFRNRVKVQTRLNRMW